jgi:hypothetical protein
LKQIDQRTFDDGRHNTIWPFAGECDAALVENLSGFIYDTEAENTATFFGEMEEVVRGARKYLGYLEHGSTSVHLDGLGNEEDIGVLQTLSVRSRGNRSAFMKVRLLAP